MRVLVALLLITITLSSVAQDLVELENGQLADADDINNNFSTLEDRILALESLGLVYTSTFPSSTFNLDFNDTTRGYSRSLAIPTESGNLNYSWGVSSFRVGDGIVSANFLSMLRWSDGDFNNNAHALCDPTEDIGFIPIEASYIISHGVHVLAFQSEPVSSSQDVENISASVACLKPKATGGFETRIYVNYEIGNSHNRFACVDVIEPVKVTQLVSEEGKEENSVDLYGINITGSSNAKLYSAVNTEVEAKSLTGEISVPATCD